MLPSSVAIWEKIGLAVYIAEKIKEENPLVTLQSEYLINSDDAMTVEL